MIRALMAMTAGQRLGAYEIVALVGSGGMGEVYRARDSRLGRDVAIKVLPPSVSADPEALGRFEREARAVGALSHPNIVSIHDVGTEGGTSYVVMELLEGETLRSRLVAASSALPKAKALEIAIQIAHGLAAAHGKSIVHRDLKPENVFLTADGRVKILDFGLARALPGAVHAISNADTVMSPTATAASVPGMILGTVGYMAPEQVRGQPADHRADIFAFGAVFFEMLAGQRAFAGESPIEMMSAILKQDPLEQPAAALSISGPLEPLLRHCLEKQPDERFQSARDLAFQLQVIAGASGAASSSAAGHVVPDLPRSRRGWLVPAAIALAATVAGLGLGRYLFGATSAELTSVTSTVLLPSGVLVIPGPNPARSGGLAVSRDGRKIAFAGLTAKGPQIFVRAIDSSVARPVPGTEGGTYPTWSPDGKRLAFWQDRQLRQVPADGGAPQFIANMVNPRSAATWGPDDTLLFHEEYRQPLTRVSAAGGTPIEVLPALGGNVSWFSPVWLPDGRRFLVIKFAYVDTEAKTAGIYAGSVDSKDVTLVVAGEIAEVAVGEEELFYRKGTDLIAQPFDSSTLTLSGNPRVLSNHVSMVAASGPTLVYFDPPGGLSLGHRITWFSRSGAMLSTTGDASSFRDPRISPDERAIVIARANESGVFGLWTYNVARNIDTKVSGTTFVSPTWSRDSRSIIAGTTGQGLFRFDATGSSPPTLIRAGGVTVLDVNGDGRILVRIQRGVKYQFAVLPLDGSADPTPLSADLQDSIQGSFSSDGKWVAMAAIDGNTSRLHVQPYPGPGGRIPVSALRASHPRWRSDNRELYFLSQVDGENAVMAVPVTWSGGVPDFGPAQVLFKIANMVVSNLAFDVTKDGQRFVAIVAGDLDPSPLTMVIRAGVR